MSRRVRLGNFQSLIKFRYAFVLLLVIAGNPLVAHAAGISGRVINQTTGKPSSGDEVVLLRLGDGMQEVERARTNAQGAFSFAASGSDADYVVRVLHQGVNYDQKLNVGVPPEISIYDSVAKVRDVTGSMGIAQVESDGKDLKVTEMYSISNASNPPVTQANPRNFEISLPDKAVLDAFQVKRASGVWVNQTPVAIAGSKRHLAVDFPLRPGDTLFKFSYRLPQQSHTALKVHLAYQVRNFGVVHPPSISFKSSRANAFTSPGVIKGLKLEQMVSNDTIRDVPAFELAGVGTAPLPSQSAQQSAAASPETQSPGRSATDPTKQSQGQGHALPQALGGSLADAPEKGRELWAILSAMTALMIAGMVFITRRRKRTAKFVTNVNRVQEPFAVDAIRDELRQLEKEKQYGAISAEEYDSARQALSVSLERAMARGQN